ncbi:MAG: PGF-pre-PGF domain-containing protein [DPANN group archaeon]|nr:PGF-pre-PGF domain-containing protein [DPANN group archaeon]
MGGWPLHKYFDVLIVLFFVTSIFSFAAFEIGFSKTNQNKITGSFALITGATHINASGACGNNEIEEKNKEECDGLDDYPCPRRCTDKCTCLPASKRVLDLSYSANYLYNFYFPNASNHSSSSFTFDKPQFAFNGMEFGVVSEQRGFSFLVNVNVTKQGSLNAIPYQYFEVTLRNITETNITTTNVTFKVPKSWVSEKGIDPKTIVLKRLMDKASWTPESWQDKTTIRTADEALYYKFKAVNVGLNAVFVVAGLPEINCGDGVCGLAENKYNCCTDCGCSVGNTCVENTCRESKCGNQIVDAGENSETCCMDAGCPSGQSCRFGSCQIISSCSNSVCEKDEGLLSCPQDCIKPLFFKPGFYALIFIVIIALAAPHYLLRPRKAAKLSKLIPMPKIVSLETEIRQEIIKNIFMPRNELKKHLTDKGYSPELAEKILTEFKPAIPPIAKKKFDLRKHAEALLETKPIEEVKSELELNGWPAEQVRQVLKSILLEKLALAHEMHIGPRSREKFQRFRRACGTLYSRKEIIDLLEQYGWDRKTLEGEFS